MHENDLAKWTLTFSHIRNENREVKNSKKQGYYRKSTIQQLSNFTFPKGIVPRQAGINTQFVIQWEVEEFATETRSVPSSPSG